ncbi:MAG TPA: hypothetical protein VJQ09_03275 [Candidatus Limnocylindria bacterium]|nr:hypothetical protein [Candidatus Limnocylindria bacterium]
MRAFGRLAVIAFLVAACSSAPGYRTLPESATPAPSGATSTAPAYLTMTLTDVRTGERFTLASQQGKTVIFEAMAVW